MASMRTLPLLLLVLAGLSACRPGGPGADDDGGLPPDAGTQPRDGGVDAGDPWAQVRAHVAAGAQDAGVELGLFVYDATDTQRFAWTTAGFSADTRLSIASASKLAVSPVFFELIRQGKLTLGSTTGAVLGWVGPKGAITLEQLLSFTSGLPPSPTCAFNPLTTLAACVQDIEAAGLSSPPGTRYDYGPVHLAVAGRMAEVVTGQRWNELFTALVGGPLGFGAEARSYAVPTRQLGALNPLVSGGLRLTTAEYARLLQLVFHQGTRGGVTLGTPALYEAQAREPFPSATVGDSPMRDVGLPYRYGLAAWLECDTPATGCAVLSSPGAFGFTPWLDRDAGYVALLAMEQSGGTAEIGVVAFSVHLAQGLKPLVVDALGR